MNMPTRKPRLWHFTYSNLICLAQFCKDGVLQYFWEWYRVACMLYFYCLRNFQLSDPPVRTPGVKSRIRPPYPQRVVKGD